jgi:HD superfamily phosphohydrolase
MFERVAKENLKQKAQDHEDWTVAIIKEHDKVSGILGEFNKWIGNRFADLNKRREEDKKEPHPTPNIFEDLAKVYEHIYQPDFVTDLISSQMDVDRFDYLMRDSRNAGCHYGDFDIRWIFRSLLVVDVDPKNLTEANDNGDEIEGNTGVRQVLAVLDEKGRNCVEEYILGRHYMYIHLYYHKTIVGAEALLQRILKRAVEAVRRQELEGDYPVLRSIAVDQNPPIQDYLRLDDHVVLGWVSSWSRGIGCKDALLQNLSARLVQRELFVKIVPPTDGDKYADARDAIRKGLTDAGLDPDYYFMTAKLSDTAHKDFLYYLSKNKADGFNDIRIYDVKKDTVRNLSHVKRSIVVAGSNVLTHDEKGWFVPREFAEQARQIVDA